MREREREREIHLFIPHSQHFHSQKASLLKSLTERASYSFPHPSQLALLMSGLEPQMPMMNPDNVGLKKGHRWLLERDCMRRSPSGGRTCSLDRICICHIASRICTMVLPDAMASPKGSRGSLERGAVFHGGDGTDKLHQICSHRSSYNTGIRAARVSLGRHSLSVERNIPWGRSQSGK